jgi:hypothetical protein
LIKGEIGFEIPVRVKGIARAHKSALTIETSTCLTLSKERGKQ